MSKRRKLPKGWIEIPLGQTVDIVIGGTPSRKDNSLWLNGEFPWVTIRDLNGTEVIETNERISKKGIEKSNAKQIPKGTTLVSFKLSLGKVGIAGTDLFTNEAVAALIPMNGSALDEYLFFLFQFLDLHEFARDAVKGKTLNKAILQKIEIPLPPLAVQERIVEVLQQADAIRHKRAEARRLADQILPALFNQSFLAQEDKWKFLPLKECVFFKSGGTPSRKNEEYWKGDIPWVSPSDMKSLEITDTEEHISEVAVEKSATNLVEPSTLLIVVRSGILAHTFPVAIVRRQVAFNQDIKALTPRDGMLLPEFLLWAIRAQSNQVLRTMVKRGSTVHSIDTETFPNLQIPVPSLTYQQNFVEQASKMYEVLKNRETASVWGEELFSTLLSRAFTGELTAEWETENADWIAERQAFYERLPRLALLTLLQERHERAERNAETLITALMKYVFLTQMEGSLHRRLYRFVPYHYGPCAMELYGDLEALANDGLIVIESDAEEDKTRIKLVDPNRTAVLLEEEAKKDDTRLAAMDQSDDEAEAVTDPVMPRLLRRRAEILETLRTDSATILDAYGDLDHNTLLNTVYEKYPAYAKKSRIKKGRKASSGKTRGRGAKK